MNQPISDVPVIQIRFHKAMRRNTLVFSMLLVLAMVFPARGESITAHERTLSNGLRIVVVPRQNEPGRCTAGWACETGTVYEQQGMIGVSRMIERMLAQGTSTRGTKDIDAERDLMAQQDTVAISIEQMIAEIQVPRYLAGEIDDPFSRSNDTEAIAAKRAELARLIDQHRRLMTDEPFDALYEEAGGRVLSMAGGQDVTLYTVNLPSSALPLFAWMESNRLRDPVFRRFYLERETMTKEVDVQRINAPLVAESERFTAQFWGKFGYGQPTTGTVEDLRQLLRPRVRQYFETYFRPDRMVFMVVGDVDPEAVFSVLDNAFSDWEPAVAAPPAIAPPEKISNPGFMFEVIHNGGSLIEFRARSVPFHHPDSAPLQILGSLLNGTGGLFAERLVGQNGRPTAQNFSASQVSRKYGGHFTMTGQIQPGVASEDVRDQVLSILESIRTNPPAQNEVARAIRHTLAQGYRQLVSNDAMTAQLLSASALINWQVINEQPAMLKAVTSADIVRVIETYLLPEQIAVGMYRSSREGEGGIIPAEDLDRIPEVMRGQVERLLSEVLSSEDVNQLNGVAQQFSGVAAQAPPEMRPAFEYILERIQKRVIELEAAQNQNPE